MENNKNTVTDRLVCGLYFLMTACGLLISLLTLLQVEQELKSFWILAAGTALWYILVCWNKWTVRILMPFSVLGTAAFLVRRRELFTDGCKELINLLRSPVEEYYGAAYRHFETSGSQEAFFTAVAVLVFVLFGILGFCLLYRRRMWLLFGIFVLLSVFGLLVNCFPAVFPFFLLVIGTAGLRAVTLVRYTENRGKISLKLGVLMMALLSGAVLCSYLVIRPAAEPEMLKKSPEVQQAQEKLEASVSEKFNKIVQGEFEFLDWLGNDHVIEDGKLSNYSGGKDGKTVMKITAGEKPEQTLYLKGFVGDTYQGDSWKIISDKVYQKVAALRDFPPSAKEELQKLPYEYLQECESVLGVPFGGQSYWKREYEIEILERGEPYAYIPYFAKPRQPLNYEADGLVLRKGQETLFYEVYEKFQYFGNYSAIADQNSRIMEEKYREYVYDRYLQIPEGLTRLENYANQLTDYCRGRGMDTLETAAQIQKALQKECTYNLDLERLPKGEDFTEYFLFEQKEGFCIHFASAGVLLLRMAGIPARYVTGYMADADAFQSVPGGYRAEVTDRDAHAWAEIYLDQMGWVPVEMTPGYPQVLRQNIEEEPVEGEDLTLPVTAVPTPTEEPEASETPQATPEADQPGGVNQPQKIEVKGKLLPQIRLLLEILGAAAGLCLIFGLRRGIAEIRRSHLFSFKNPNRAVREMTAEICRMLAAAGYGKEKCENEKAYALQIQSELKGLKPEEFLQFFAAGERAAFSSETFTKEQAECCGREYNRIRGLIMADWGIIKKLWWKYIKAF